MTFVVLIIISVIVYLVTISLVVIGQEISALLAIALFCALAYGAYKLAAKRLTKL